MPDSGKYTPLSERLQQDVWHDNFVPKYSSLASSKPSRLVLIGVWLIFGPMALGLLVGGVSQLARSPDLATAVIFSIAMILFFALAVAVLYVQTRRYLVATSKPRELDDEHNAAQASE